jgi:hypothetical protein
VRISRALSVIVDESQSIREGGGGRRMRLIEALELCRRPVSEGAPELNVFLACGFTPLHLPAFLAAALRVLRPGARVEVRTGLFGDLNGLIRLQPPSS